MYGTVIGYVDPDNWSTEDQEKYFDALAGDRGGDDRERASQSNPESAIEQATRPTHSCRVCDRGKEITTPYKTVPRWCDPCGGVRDFVRIARDE